MKIGVLGAGYVGLVTGIGLARFGHEITLVDTEQAKIEMINRMQSPIFEKGTEAMLRDLIGSRLEATCDLMTMAKKSGIIFLCVGTPSQPNGAIDLTDLKKALTDVGAAITGRRDYPVIVVKSTVIPGTTEEIIIPILEEKSGCRAGREFGVVVNPEFFREGEAMEDFLHPGRIVIGESDTKSGDILNSLCDVFSTPVLRVNLRTAEMIKYTSNAALAAKISFANEIGNICKLMGIDVYQVMAAVGLDPRISPQFLEAGLGFGGSCLPKDVKALIVKAKDMGYQPNLLENIITVNEGQPTKLVDLAESELGGLKGKNSAVLGLAFKPSTTDMREAPSIKVIQELLRRDSLVKAYDPLAVNEAKLILGTTVDYAADAAEAVADADAVFIMTEWDEFKNPAIYQGKKVFAGRRVLKPEQTEGLAYYEGLGW
jgi:UDPglucose 6-dehydrogenase